MAAKSLNDLLEIAIGKEIEAFNLYTGMLSRTTDKAVRETLEFIADEEKNHKKMLEDYRNGQFKGSLELEDVVDYKIAEHTGRNAINSESEIKDIYLFAAHEEFNAYNFYMNLADNHADGDAKRLLLKIANEEKKHKEKVEYYYTNSAFPQNAGG